MLKVKYLNLYNSNDIDFSISNIQKYFFYALLGLLFSSLIILPKDFPPIGIEYYKLICTALMLFNVSLSLIARKKIYWSLYDFVFLVLVFFHFLSHFWARFNYAIWPSSFEIFFLFLIYFTVKQHWHKIDYSVIIKVAFLVVLINLFSMSFFWYQLIIEEGQLIFGQTKKMGTYFGKNDNYLASLFCLTSPMFILFRQRLGLNMNLLIILFSFHTIILILFQSRGALLSFTLIWVFYLFYNLGLKKMAITILSFFVIICSILFLGISEPAQYFQKLSPLASFDENSADERLLIWKKTLQLIAEKPWLGNGVNQFKYLFPSTNMSDFRFSFNKSRHYLHAHNFLLEKCMELGIIGVLLWSFILLFPLFIWWKKKGNFSKVWAMIILSFLGTSFFYGVLYYSPHNFQPLLTFTFLIIGVILSKPKASTTPRNTSKVLNLILIFLTLLSLFYLLTQRINGLTFQKIQKFKSQKQYKEAAVSFDELLIPIWSKTIRIHPIEFQKGVNMWLIKRNSQAISQMEKGLKDDPFNISNNMKLASCYFQKKKYEEAEKLCRHIISINDSYFNANFMLARIALSKQNEIEFNLHLDNIRNKITPLFQKYYNDLVWYRASETGIKKWLGYCKVLDKIDKIQQEAQQYF